MSLKLKNQHILNITKTEMSPKLKLKCTTEFSNGGLMLALQEEFTLAPKKEDKKIEKKK